MFLGVNIFVLLFFWFYGLLEGVEKMLMVFDPNYVAN